MQPSSRPPLRIRIMEIVPRDSHFTLADVVERLEDDVSIASVRTTLNRLIDRGEIKQVRRGNKESPAIFAIAGFGSNINNLNAVSQIQAAEIVLQQIGQPVELSVLVDEMLNRGFVPNNDAKTLKKSLATSMRLKSQFVKDGKFWSLRK